MKCPRCNETYTEAEMGAFGICATCGQMEYDGLVKNALELEDSYPEEWL